MTSLGKFFGDLKVRPKLMVLHNSFFIILGCAVYFSLIPAFEQRVAEAQAREVSLVTQMFSEEQPLLRLPGMEIYDYREGTAAELGIPGPVVEWLNANPGHTWSAEDADYLYRQSRHEGTYRSLKLPADYYRRIVSHAKWTLLLALGAVYVLAVLLLELLIMPRYVYKPLRLMLDADRATQRGDREHELVSEKLIPGDEIGQILRSRNATIADLRRQEASLAEIAEDLKRKNHLLETAKKNLADQDRLVSLGLLSASVAHEINTPLSVLRGSIEKLMETLPGEATQERLRRMMRVTERLRRISEGLLDFARTRRQEMAPVLLRGVVEEAWGLVMLDERARGVRFRNEVRKEDAVTGNADRLVQVFVNLLRNSIYAIQSSGSIVVQSRRFADNGQDWVAVSVEDDGPGIPADVLPDIFEAFVTSRLDARGTGLGLTVAEGIVYQHGGAIEAANRPTGGARLEIRLPAVHNEVIA